jgi:hypothetical protein
MLFAIYLHNQQVLAVAWLVGDNLMLSDFRPYV